MGSKKMSGAMGLASNVGGALDNENVQKAQVESVQGSLANMKKGYSQPGLKGSPMEGMLGAMGAKRQRHKGGAFGKSRGRMKKRSPMGVSAAATGEMGVGRNV